MSANLTCTQVSALLSFYIEDKLSVQLKQFVESHLEVCPSCRAKLEALTNMVNSLKEIHEKIATIKSRESNEGSQTISQNDEFKENLSAYVDNELSDEDNLKVKKYIVSNPKARKDLETMYNLRKALQNSFDKAKNDVREDYSKYILKRIDIQEEIYGPDSFAKVVALFIIILAVFTITAVIVFWI